MSDLERARPRGAGDLRAILIESGHGESPPPGAHARTLAALGVGTAVGASVAGNAAAAVVPHASHAGKLILAAKWAAIGATTAVVGVGVGAAHGVFPNSEPHRSTVVAVAPRPASVQPGREPKAASPREEALEIEPLVLAPSARPPQTAAPRPSVPGTQLAQEIAFLDSARKALESNAPSRAMAILEAYAQTFPAGELAPEAGLLRVDALLGLGNVAGARKVAAQLLRANPSSPHKARLDRLFAERGLDRPTISRSTSDGPDNEY